MKKQQQLGMNPSTASGRLVKDILYSLVMQTGQNNCFQCGFPMSRETFSVEHKEPWLDSYDPVGLYFDLENISFSHHSCNVAAGRKPNKKYDSKEEAKEAHLGISREWKKENRTYDPEERRQRYKRFGT